MKKSFEKVPLLMLLASLILAITSAAVRSYLTLTALDARYGVYEHGNILPDVYHILLAVALLALVIIAFVKAPKRAPDYTRPHSDLTIFASCICAFMLIADVFMALYYIVVNRTPLTTFDILELCFSVPAVLYFLGLVRSQTKRSTALALTSLFPTAWCAVCLIRIYFDNSVLQVSPNKIMGELALLSAMIYLLSESRAQLGTMKHKLYLAAATAAPVLLFTSAVPNLLFPNQISIGESDDFIRYAIEVALALFIWARLFAYAKRKQTNQ